MSDITDELLDELESLELNTNQLNQKVEDVKQSKKTLDHAPSADKINSTSLLLEASRVTQQAAQYSQETADINLKTSQKLQIQLDDMQEIALASRQAMRNANQDAKSSRKFVTALSVFSILTIGALTSITGWFLYSVQQDQNSLEQQVIDIIKTENNLNQRHLNLKINELASLIELSVADLKNPPEQFDLQFEQDMPISETHQTEDVPVAVKTDTSETTLANTQQLTTQLESNQTALLAALTQLQRDLEQQAKQLQTIPSTAMSQPTVSFDSLNPRFASLENQLKLQINEIKALQTLIKQQPRPQNAQPSNANEKDWTTLSSQVNALSEQQKTIEQALEKLSESVQALQKEIATPSGHYQYRNPYQFSN